MSKAALKAAAKSARNGHVIPDDDGFTLTRFIKGEDRMYDSLRFEFRPVGTIKRARVVERRKGLGEEEATIALAKAVAQQIVGWDAVDEEGDPLPVSAKSVQLLHPMLWSRVLAIVIYSTEGGDVDPDASRLEEQTREAPDLLGDSKGSGGVVEEEQKN